MELGGNDWKYSKINQAVSLIQEINSPSKTSPRGLQKTSISTSKTSLLSQATTADSHLKSLKNSKLRKAMISFKDKQFDVNLIKQKIDDESIFNNKLNVFNLMEVNGTYKRLKEESIRE